MQRKNKIRLVTCLYISIIFSLCIALAYLFPYGIDKGLRLSSYAFTLGCLIVPWLPWARYEIQSPHSTTSYNFFRWYGSIIAIELGLVSLFLVQYYSQLVSLSIERSNLVLISGWTGFNFALFPWTVIALLGALFAYLSIQYRTPLPWGSYLAPHQFSFFWNEVRRIVDVNFQINSRLFFVVNIILMVLWLNYLIYPISWNPYNLFFSLFVASFLFLLLYSQLFQKLLNTLENKQVKQGIQLGLLFFSVLAVVFVGSFMIEKIKPQVNSPLFTLLLGPLPITRHPRFIYTSLLCFSFWILAIPLASSWLVKISQGRTIRQFLIGVLSFPLIIVGLTWFIKTRGWIIPLPSFQFPLHLYLPTLFGLIMLGFVAQRPDIADHLWLGYFPYYPLEKAHRTPMEQLWLFTIALLAIEIVLPTQGLVLGLVPFVLPLWLIFLVTFVGGLLFSRSHSS